jgi:hypothetical protein
MARLGDRADSLDSPPDLSALLPLPLTLPLPLPLPLLLPLVIPVLILLLILLLLGRREKERQSI